MGCMAGVNKIFELSYLKYKWHDLINVRSQRTKQFSSPDLTVARCSYQISMRDFESCGLVCIIIQYRMIKRFLREHMRLTWLFTHFVENSTHRLSSSFFRVGALSSTIFFRSVVWSAVSMKCFMTLINVLQFNFNWILNKSS